MKNYKQKRVFTSIFKLKQATHQLRLSHTRIRVRGRFKASTLQALYKKFNLLVLEYNNSLDKKCILHERLPCGCHHPDYWDGFAKANPHAFTPYYNDISLRNAEKYKKFGFPVEYWKLYIY